jgi:catechol 2,3-dioxygenase-like lactoylglutathione lyase family enzyme
MPAMTQFIRYALFAALVFIPATRASAQLLLAAENPVVYGHHHVNATNLDAHKKFWADSLGGTVVKIGTDNREVIKIPNVWIFLRAQAPTGGSKGTTEDHIGLSVPSVQATLDKARANGFRVVTAQEAAPTYKVTGDIASPAPGTNLGFLLGPDDVKVELVEARDQTEPVKLHHLHFFGQQNGPMRDWYARTFGATAPAGAPNAPFLNSALPGVRMQFTPTETPTVGTAGRAYDHIGFEVKNLREFVTRLEAQGIKLSSPVNRNEVLGITTAFIEDPWGTRIELTEGLGALK